MCGGGLCLGEPGGSPGEKWSLLLWDMMEDRDSLPEEGQKAADVAEARVGGARTGPLQLPPPAPLLWH